MSILVNLSFVILGLVVVAGVIGSMVGRRSPSGERSRRQWINDQLAAQEATYPGGRFTDDEYLARLEALEERWDETP